MSAISICFAGAAGRWSRSSAEAQPDTAEAELACVRAKASDDRAQIAHLKLQIAKLSRHRFGVHSERTGRLLDQLELQLEELEASAGEDELAAEIAAATAVAALTLKRPSRKPFPEHLPRERVIVPDPCACAACGGSRLSKLGEDVTETLEVVPRQWKGSPTSVRSSPAGTARPSARPRCPSMSSPAAGPAPACWP